jgi:hypothetical protein
MQEAILSPLKYWGVYSWRSLVHVRIPPSAAGNRHRLRLASIHAPKRQLRKTTVTLLEDSPFLYLLAFLPTSWCAHALRRYDLTTSCIFVCMY